MLTVPVRAGHPIPTINAEQDDPRRSGMDREVDRLIGAVPTCGEVSRIEVQAVDQKVFAREPARLQHPHVPERHAIVERDLQSSESRGVSVLSPPSGVAGV